MKTSLSIALLACAAALAACGDNPAADTPAPPAAANEVPASATASTRAYATYTGSLAANDTAQPLEVNNVRPPTSETEEPQPI